MAGDDGFESMMAKVALECGGDISASQEDILARSSFLGAQSSHGDNHVSASASASPLRLQEEEDIFSTPPLTQQDPITICTLPFTQSQSPSDMAPRRKPRVCTRKVRGARIRTPTPTPSPKQQQQDVDPLYRAVLMIPAAATTTRQNPVEDFLALARHRGLF